MRRSAGRGPRARAASADPASDPAATRRLERGPAAGGREPVASRAARGSPMPPSAEQARTISYCAPSTRWRDPRRESSPAGVEAPAGAPQDGQKRAGAHLLLAGAAGHVRSVTRREHERRSTPRQSRGQSVYAPFGPSRAARGSRKAASRT
jgi:hypothetical protein